MVHKQQKLRAWLLFIFEFRSHPLYLLAPSQTARFLGIEVEEIKKTIWVFNVANNVSDIGAMGEHGIDGFNEFIFVYEDTLLSRRVSAAAGCPGLDVSNIAADTADFIVHAA